MLIAENRSDAVFVILVVMKFIAAIILLCLLGAMFLSLLHISHMQAHDGMADCPFMAPGEVICSMNATEHLSALKAAFMAILPAISLLLLVLVSVSFVLSCRPDTVLSRFRLPIKIAHQPKPTYTHSYRSLQDYFASGLLHPKVF